MRLSERLKKLAGAGARLMFAWARRRGTSEFTPPKLCAGVSLRGVVTLLFAGVLASGCSATPVATATATATPTVTATSTATPVATATATPTATVIPTATPTVTAAPGDAAILSHLYALEREIIILKRFDGRGGAIESLGHDLLVATPKGRLALVAGNGEVVYLDGQVPMNLAGLEAHEEYDTLEFDPKFFRVTDILLKEAGAGRYELFATHHYFSGECIRFRLSVTTLLHDGESATVLSNWRTVFDAEPCIAQRHFNGQYAGGKMVEDGAEHLLVLTGSNIRGWEGWAARPSFDTDNHMGKLLRIELESGEAEVLAIGFRNSQGLARDAEGNLWATEHGPQGGDELNLLERGGHYGWPHVTYGVEYGGMVPPEIEDAKVGRHEGFRRPAFAWVPAVAATAITVNDADWFPLWKDDLLLASLKAGSLFRVRRVGTEVQYVEKIEIGIRIRDLATLPGGRIALLQNTGQVHFLRRSPRYCDEAAPERRDVYSIDCESLSPLPAVAGGLAAQVERLMGGRAPAIEADFEVWLAEGQLVYRREGCAAEDVEAMFFLHLVPLEVEDLPAERREIGFDNLDFYFEWYGARNGATCLAVVPLPTYGIAEIHTGQSVARDEGFENLWAGAIWTEALVAALIGGAAPDLSADFEVWLAEGQLVYRREDCAAEDVDAPFFLHLVPLDVGDLPAERREIGFENRDFLFEQNGRQYGATCLAVAPLPTYSIAEIHTGQFVARDGGIDNLWRGAIRTEALVERLMGGRAPAIAADFEVWLAEGQLVYRREDCAAEDVAARFFLHIVPLEVEDLPAEQREYGFDNLDFDFERYGARNGATCLAVVSLPTYDIAEIRTGQFETRDEDFENLWTGTIRPA